MNFTDSFQDFSSKFSTTDLALYAGVGLVLWVMFKDKLSPVQKFLMNLFAKVKNNTELPSLPLVPVVEDKEDLFFQLVASWKQTRDLAVRSGCQEAIKVADQMFPYLSPMGCSKKDNA